MAYPTSAHSMITCKCKSKVMNLETPFTSSAAPCTTCAKSSTTCAKSSTTSAKSCTTCAKSCTTFTKSYTTPANSFSAWPQPVGYFVKPLSYSHGYGMAYPPMMGSPLGKWQMHKRTGYVAIRPFWPVATILVLFVILVLILRYTPTRAQKSVKRIKVSKK